ncbi:uncharacterized protein LOC117120268 [Anneissia japonica]|uniref:uncharacterized protein LOC117120268 n=1 Tax=Anneissia japonica TaxID=1529436 RepID=UPI0014259A94|nr:uncharacterized protein LOC117120268 [Anneissia japonica]
MKNFDVNVAKKLSNNAARLSYLVQLTKGKAKRSIECCVLLGDDGYAVARDILEKQFGHSHIILHAMMNEMLNCRVTTSDPESMWRLISMMKKCEITMTQMKYETNLNNPENLLKIQHLLPQHNQRRWANKAQEIINGKREPSFRELIKFLENEAAASNNLFGRAIKDHTPRERMTKQTKSFFTNKTYDERCPNCT